MLPNASSAHLWNGATMPDTLTGAMTDISDCQVYLFRLARCWDTPAKFPAISIEWSKRLRRALGRAYPERQLIRLSELLKTPEYEHLFHEVLCHEAAHIAVFETYGKGATSHGPEWQELVRLAGFEPRLSHSVDSARSQEENHVLYEHICPICHTRRLARRPQLKWRCVACQNAGLDGEMAIRSRPKYLESSDA